MCCVVGLSLPRFFQWVMSKPDPGSKVADSAKAVYISGLHEALVLSSGHAHFTHFIPVSGPCEEREGRDMEGERGCSVLTSKELHFKW